LIDFADDEGFGSAEPVDLKADIFIDDDLTLEQVENFLQELVEAQEKDPMVVIFDVKNSKNSEDSDQYYWLPKFFDFQPKPDYPTPSKIANLLIDMGKLDSKFALSIHRKFSVRHAIRKATRTEKKSSGLGLGLGVGVGLGDKKKNSCRSKPSDPRVTELKNFWIWKFEETFGVEPAFSFGRDFKLFKDLLGYVDSQKKIPADCKVLLIINLMADYLEKQKERDAQYKKTTVPGFKKAFETLITEVDWDNPDWEGAKKEYGDIKKEIGIQRKVKGAGPDQDASEDAAVQE